MPPLDKLLNFGPFPMPGDGNTVNVGELRRRLRPAQPPVHAHDQRPRRLEPHATGLQPRRVGPARRGTHWGDLVNDYLHGTYHTVPWTADQIQQAAEGTLTLQP